MNKFQEKFKLNQTYHGFTLKQQEYLDSVQGTAYYFVYGKTQTPLLYIANDDHNKVFHIAFRTPSNNSTGVAHINEHTVLCGSRKYPLKEPFVELIKGSLNTFLNAMTYPDKTVYPVASTNDKDFMNLMDVYLDAVFYPNIYQKEEIFKQEGWHYHLEKPEDPITYNGVVYNEMKGVYSSPEEVLHNELLKQLYPDSIYGKESGGYPDNIPDLAYQDFLDFHSRFYHPSNAFIYLYGDGDMDAHLAYLDAEYLSHFEYKEIDSRIRLQRPLTAMRHATATYPFSGEKDLKQKDYLTIGWVLNDLGDDWLAFDILTNVLLGDNSYPLKKALLDLDISDDISYSYTTSMEQPYFAISFKNTDHTKEELIGATIEKTLTDLVKNGIDPKNLEAGINSAAFTIKEQDFGSYPKGLMFGLELMDTWLYGGDPLDHLRYDDALDRIHQMQKNRGFEDLIQRLLLNNHHAATVSITPDPELSAKKETALSQQLADYKDQLSDNEIKTLVDQTQTLLAYQSSPDTNEALETIPKLSLDDLGKAAREIPFARGTMDQHLVLWHPAETAGIVYVKLMFDVRTIAQEDLPVLGLLNKLLFNVNTKSYDVETLNREIQIKTGGISSSIESFDHTVRAGDYRPVLTISGKVLQEHLPDLMALMIEGITASLFDNRKIIGDIIQEQHMAAESKFLSAGNTVAVQRLQSYYSQSAALYQKVGGVDFGRYLARLDKALEDQFETLAADLNRVAYQVFNRNHMTISITCEPSIQNRVYHQVKTAMDTLPQKAVSLHTYRFNTEVLNEGFMTAAKINYVAKGFNIKKLGHSYNGAFFVLKTTIGMDYLWNRIRLQGGAYGAAFGIARSGELAFSSYRDPQLAKSLATYNGAGQYIRRLDMTQRELEKYIIGAISAKDHPVSQAMTSHMADSMYLTGITAEDRQRERDEILSVKLQDLRDCGEIVDEAMQQNNLCVVGNEELIRNNQEIFNNVTYIFE